MSNIVEEDWFDPEKLDKQYKHYTLEQKIKAFFADVVLIWILTWIYFNIPFYVNFIGEEPRNILLGIAFVHLFALWPLYIHKKANSSYGIVLLTVARRQLNAAKRMLANHVPDYENARKYGWGVTEFEKNSLLALGVKAFFIPLMIVFTVGNFQSVLSTIERFDWYNVSFSMEFFNNVLFELILRIMFLVDTLCFLIGYLTDLDGLDNHIKTVEPTWLGWFVALAAYPPFNGVTGQIIPTYGNDYIIFWNTSITFAMRIVILFLFGIYTWASIALGTKASNLTNRGIVEHGPYKYIRHPAYISKTTVWLLTTLPIANFTYILTTLGVMFLYFMRAITEERHLARDPDYIKYCKKVKYRFIPYVF